MNRTKQNSWIQNSNSEHFASFEMPKISVINTWKLWTKSLITQKIKIEFFFSLVAEHSAKIWTKKWKRLSLREVCMLLTGKNPRQWLAMNQQWLVDSILHRASQVAQGENVGENPLTQVDVRTMCWIWVINLSSSHLLILALRWHTFCSYIIFMNSHIFSLNPFILFRKCTQPEMYVLFIDNYWHSTEIIWTKYEYFLLCAVLIVYQWENFFQVNFCSSNLLSVSISQTYNIPSTWGFVLWISKLLSLIWDFRKFTRFILK